MSRSGYDDCIDNWKLIKWRGAVTSALRGKRGQAFLREMRDALDALPVKRLITDELVAGGEVCALGAVGVSRGIPMGELDPYDEEYYNEIAAIFGISSAMVREIMYLNDECFCGTPEQRYERMRKWVGAWTSGQEPAP